LVGVGAPLSGRGSDPDLRLAKLLFPRAFDSTGCGLRPSRPRPVVPRALRPRGRRFLVTSVVPNVPGLRMRSPLANPSINFGRSDGRTPHIGVGYGASPWHSLCRLVALPPLRRPTTAHEEFASYIHASAVKRTSTASATPSDRPTRTAASRELSSRARGHEIGERAFTGTGVTRRNTLRP
jgi:hypothetical protein